MRRRRDSTTPPIPEVDASPLMRLVLAPPSRISTLADTGEQVAEVDEDLVVCGMPECGLEAFRYVRREAACGVLAAALVCEEHAETVGLILQHMSIAELAASVAPHRLERTAARCRAKADELRWAALSLRTNPDGDVSDEFLEANALHRTQHRALQLTRIVWRAVAFEEMALVLDYLRGVEGAIPPIVDGMMVTS